MDVREIAYESAEYDAMLAVRERVLRGPLGKRLCIRDVDGEESQWHFAAFDDENHLIGCVILKPLSETHLKLRQMAVVDQWQRRGVGTRLVEVACQTARQRGYDSIELTARMTAVSFYERLGCDKISDEFEEVGLPHVLMRISLAESKDV